MQDLINNSLFYASIVVSAAYLIILVLYWYVLKNLHTKSTETITIWPKISILIAARNEADNILHCLNSIEALDYPKDQLQIIVGNDQSQDDTGLIIANFITNKPYYKLIHLNGSEYPQTKGKARVLACLADSADGDYLLITDADVIVPSSWAKTMVNQMLVQNADMIGGVTNIQTKRFFLQFQHIDWLYFMGIIHAFGQFGKPLTVVGNNMALSKKAYLSTGGYGEIPFSITEDYALYKAVKAKGFKVAMHFHKDVMVLTHPIDSLKGLLKQRKRWLTGGWDLPLYYHIMIAVFGAWYFALPILWLIHWPWALGLLLVKNALQLAHFYYLHKHLEQRMSHWGHMLLYDVYLGFVIPLTAIYFLLPFKNQWKGRTY